MTPAVSDQRSARIRALRYDYAAREQEPVPACNLCDSNTTIEVSRRDRYGFPAVLLLCARCGLGWISPRLTPPEYAQFYRATYRPLVSAYHGRRIDTETVQVEQGDYGADLADYLRRALPASPRDLLDIGGSTGVVADAVREAFGARATVLDPAPEELAVAEAAGMETIAGFVEDFDPAGRTWDLVLLCQTIDHLLDVASTLRAMRCMLMPGGHAYVDVLDVSFMLRCRGAIEGAVKIDHPYYLTRSTARGFFARAGLRPVGERRSDDGHIGFLLAPSEPAEPDWAELHAAADVLLEEIWRLRAER